MVVFDSEIKVLVEYLNMRKCIKVLDSDYVRDFVDSAFSGSPVRLPSEYILQYFDADLQDYVDLDDFEVLLTNRKVKIVAVNTLCDDKTLVKSTDLDSTIQSSMNITELNDSALIQSTDLDSIKSINVTKLNDSNIQSIDDSGIDCEDNNVEPDCSIQSSSSRMFNWPHPFLIKDKMIRPLTLKLLESKAKLTVADVSSLLVSVFEEAIQYTL